MSRSKIFRDYMRRKAEERNKYKDESKEEITERSQWDLNGDLRPLRNEDIIDMSEMDRWTEEQEHGLER